MRCSSKSVIVAVIALSGAAIMFAKKDESIDQLKARVASANPEQRVGLCVEIAGRQLDAAEKFYAADKNEEGRTAIGDVVAYSEKATEAATQSGKKLKRAEIEVRKMAHKLRDLKGTIAYEDQAPVQEAIDRLEKLRTELLTKMFGAGKKSP